MVNAARIINEFHLFTTFLSTVACGTNCASDVFATPTSCPDQPKESDLSIRLQFTILGATNQNKKNHESMETIVNNFKSTLGKFMEGGGEKLKSRHKARGKLLADKRIDHLVDSV